MLTANHYVLTPVQPLVSPTYSYCGYDGLRNALAPTVPVDPFAAKLDDCKRRRKAAILKASRMVQG